MKLLNKIIQEQLAPRVERGDFQFVAASELNARTNGVRVSRRKLRGKRKVVRGRRLVDNVSISVAEWPELGLVEVRYPKMVCVLSGQTDLQLGDYVVHAEEGCFIYIPPGTPQPNGSRPHLDPARQTPDNACDLFWFMLLGRRVDCWICYSRGSEHWGDARTHWTLISERAGRLFAMLIEEAESGRDGSPEIRRGLLMALLALIRSEYEAQRFLRPGPMVQPDGMEQDGPRDPVARAREYIRAHLDQPLTIESVARQVYISRTQLAARLRLETRQTFVEYLTQCRMEEAKSLLRDSDWAVCTIAGFVGFKSPTYFQDLFKRQEGMTPGEFRRRALAKQIGTK